MAETKKQKANKVEKFSLSITRNLGNYESMKLEAEWTPNEGDTDNESVCKMQKQIEIAMNAALAERTTNRLRILNSDTLFRVEHKKEGEQYPQLVTTKEEDLLQRIVSKIEAGTSAETVFQYYAFNEAAFKVIAIAAVLNPTYQLSTLK